MAAASISTNFSHKLEQQQGWDTLSESTKERATELLERINTISHNALEDAPISLTIGDGIGRCKEPLQFAVINLTDAGVTLRQRQMGTFKNWDLRTDSKMTRAMFGDDKEMVVLLPENADQWTPEMPYTGKGLRLMSLNFGSIYPILHQCNRWESVKDIAIDEEIKLELLTPGAARMELPIGKDTDRSVEDLMITSKIFSTPFGTVIAYQPQAMTKEENKRYLLGDEVTEDQYERYLDQDGSPRQIVLVNPEGKKDVMELRTLNYDDSNTMVFCKKNQKSKEGWTLPYSALIHFQPWLDNSDQEPTHITPRRKNTQNECDMQRVIPGSEEWNRLRDRISGGQLTWASKLPGVWDFDDISDESIDYDSDAEEWERVVDGMMREMHHEHNKAINRKGK